MEKSETPICGSVQGLFRRTNFGQGLRVANFNQRLLPKAETIANVIVEENCSHFGNVCFDFEEPVLKK